MNWRAQLAAWSADKRDMWRECCREAAASHPDWKEEYVEFHSFRQVRDALLFERALKLEDVPGWNAAGESRSWEEVQALPKDDSEKRLLDARLYYEARRRERAADAKPDEPRRQYAGGARR